MIIKYYNNPELAYTTRRRYRTFNFTPFAQEEQKSILFGDGANTQVKTSVNNICNYVQINDTRWYVTHYIYLNGKQIKLFLQRDVIGEFGLSECFGQIERGYTDNILKYRKELNLNQVLKKRQPLIPSSNIYGNYTVNNHDNEMWGILYIVKPADGSTNLTINIPGFEPVTVDYDFIENGYSVVTDAVSNCNVTFRIRFTNSLSNSYGNYPVFSVKINFIYNPLTNSFNDVNENAVSVTLVSGPSTIQPSWDILLTLSTSGILSDTQLKNSAKQIGILIGQGILNNQSVSKGYALPSTPSSIDTTATDYNGLTIKKDDTYYVYTTTITSKNNVGATTTNKTTFYNNYIVPYIDNKQITVGTLTLTVTIDSYDDSFLSLTLNSTLTVYEMVYNYTILSEEDAGTFNIDVSQQLVDEPFLILTVPLYNVTINGDSTYSIDKEKAFWIFNTVIESLSGDNGSLVDAQIYPYCPVLTGVSAEYKGFPFFAVNSSCYYHTCEVQLLPKTDIKKEYIEREYSIISPEQSSKFTFNFYDYSTNIEDIDGINYSKLNITIKTSLKPYSIISSAVINRSENSLKGINYESNLEGSQPSSNGFECSLSSNAYETYVRQNSNYQALFDLDKDELQQQHAVEKVNNNVSAIVNTLNATAMGAMSGAAMTDSGILNFAGSKAAGAVAGGAAAGLTVGAAMTAQTVVNNYLMDYEENLQQQRFDLQIGTIKNLPNSVNRISSFNEIIMKDFWYIIETYECTEEEMAIVDNFIERYGYSIGVFDYVINYYKDGWFLRSTLISSSFAVNLHQIAEKELAGGIYYYEQA